MKLEYTIIIIMITFFNNKTPPNPRFSVARSWLVTSRQEVVELDDSNELEHTLRWMLLPETEKTPLYSAVCSDNTALFDEVLKAVKEHLSENEDETILTSSQVSVRLNGPSTVSTFLPYGINSSLNLPSRHLLVRYLYPTPSSA